ncbi:MAG: hypothetical protein VYE68_16405 [Acidobacteriota bacterium]|nr:hypothetical protein [Acidobacteriota bacterium]
MGTDHFQIHGAMLTMRGEMRRPGRTRMPVCRGAQVLLSCLVVSTPAWGQALPGGAHEAGRKAGTYLTVGLGHGQGDLFSRSSLTEWDLALFGTNYDLVSAKVEVDRYFGDTFLQLSGFSLGYRKDGARRLEWGHMTYGLLFRDFDLSVLALKLGAGIEWGLPSVNFDQTEFAFADDGTVRYRHTYIHRNADVPFVGTTVDGAVYPVVELSVVQRPWFLLFETGMRVGVIRFNFDDFEVSPTDDLIEVSVRKRVLVPTLFVDVGIRLF